MPYPPWPRTPTWRRPPQCQVDGVDLESDGTPSDSTAEVIEATAEPETPPSSSSASALIDTLTSGDASSKSQRIIVNELLYKLERTNPTDEAAASPLLNGVWELVYNGGYSDGLLASPTRQLALFLYAGG